MDTLETAQQRTRKMVYSLEDVSSKEKLGELELFSLQKKRLGGFYKYV